MSEGSIFKDGNGTLRIERSILIVGSAIATVVAIVTILWQLFSVAASVNAQASTNAEFVRRLVTLEASLQTMQVAGNGHELRIAALRSDFEAQRLSDITFQTEQRAAIGHITEIVTDVRLALSRGLLPGRK